jgi:subtilisin family serine protease
VQKALDRLEEFSIVEHAEPNVLFSKLETTPNDPDWGAQYGPVVIQSQQAWDLTTGVSSVTIAIIDTGVDLDHPDLKNKIVVGYDFVNNDNNPQDDEGHGTHCAGIAAAESNNGIGIAGISWESRIMPIKVLNSVGEGWNIDIIEGIIWAVDQGADIINMSLGGSYNSSIMEDAINYAVLNGVTVIAASGDNGNETTMFPAAFEEVIAVGATDSDSNLAAFSNYGDYVDLTAPGVSIYSTILNDSYTSLSGTSMAAPHVAGAAALLRGYGSKFNTPDKIRSALVHTALDRGSIGWDKYYGWGVVQLYDALRFNPASVTPTPTPTPIPYGGKYSYSDSDDEPDLYDWVDATDSFWI